MSGDLDLEQRYRRVLRVLPGCRERWPADPASRQSQNQRAHTQALMARRS